MNNTNLVLDWRVKPCPFCGGEPVTGLTKTYESACHPNAIEAVVRCPNCKIEQKIRFNIPISGKLLPFTDILNTCSLVVDKWNARSNNGDKTD